MRTSKNINGLRKQTQPIEVHFYRSPILSLACCSPAVHASVSTGLAKKNLQTLSLKIITKKTASILSIRDKRLFGSLHFVYYSQLFLGTVNPKLSPLTTFPFHPQTPPDRKVSSLSRGERQEREVNKTGLPKRLKRPAQITFWVLTA
jgi:hypothetical protein